MRDRMMLPEIPVQARVGCTEEERAEPQMLLIDIELGCDLSHAASEDSIEAAIDYVEVRSVADQVAGARPYALIETIADGVAESLLKRFAAEEVRVRVRKPTALAEFGVPWASVEVVRNHVARAYLGLGSNLGDREGHLQYALTGLSRIGTVLARAPLIETDPVDCPGGGVFLNTCICLESSLEPSLLLSAAMRIERQRGRNRTKRNEPRVLDIDILLYGDLVLRESDLAIPHPRMHERGFVLEPLFEIAPDVLHPSFNVSVRRLLEVHRSTADGRGCQISR